MVPGPQAKPAERREGVMERIIAGVTRKAKLGRAEPVTKNTFRLLHTHGPPCGGRWSGCNLIRIGFSERYE